MTNSNKIQYQWTDATRDLAHGEMVKELQTKMGQLGCVCKTQKNEETMQRFSRNGSLVHCLNCSIWYEYKHEYDMTTDYWNSEITFLSEAQATLVKTVGNYVDFR